MPRLPVIPFIFTLIISGATFAQTGEVPLTFQGISCATDCAEEQAGFEWGKENVPASTGDCEIQSHSFNEGCGAWVNEQISSDEAVEFFEFDESVDNIIE